MPDDLPVNMDEDEVEDDSDSDDSDSDSEFEVDEQDMASIMQLESQLEASANMYDVHVQVGERAPASAAKSRRMQPHARPSPLSTCSTSACCARTG